jgi:hypothetical protein
MSTAGTDDFVEIVVPVTFLQHGEAGDSYLYDWEINYFLKIIFYFFIVTMTHFHILLCYE